MSRSVREPPARAGDFVGREGDLGELRSAVDRSVTGAGTLVLLSGEAGIGKTRLVHEAAGHARAAGMAVRHGRGWEGGGAPVYWPWIQIVRAHAADRDAEQLLAEVGSSAGHLARLGPQVAELLSTAPIATREDDAEQARFRLFDAVASLLRRAAGTTPLFLSLDDLQWSDVASVSLLQFVAEELRSSPVLLVGVVRDLEVDPSSELGGVLGALGRDAVSLPLSGLEQADVVALLAQHVGPHEAERLAPDVQRRSAGNPLYVKELGRLLRTPELRLPGAPPLVPDTLRAVIERRLAKVPTDVAGLLRLAAVIGEAFRLEVVAGAAGRPHRDVLRLLDDAVAARLVRASSTGALELEFTHAVVREVLYDQLPLVERAELHRRVGEALDQGPTRDRSLAEIAHHFLRAAPVVADHRAVDYAERSARAAVEQLSYEDAAVQLARAVDALDVVGGDEERRARLLLDLGDARLRAGRVEEARRTFRDAATVARRRGAAALLAEAALGFAAGPDGFEVRLFDRAQIDLLEEALDRLGPGDDPLRAWLLARLSVALTFAEGDERRLALAEEAVSIARRVGDVRSLAYALGAHCDAIAGPQEAGRRLAQSSEMIELSRRTADLRIELLGRRLRLVALLELGEIAAVDAEIDGFAATADALRQPVHLWYVPMWRGMRALMEGRLQESRALAEEARRLGARAESDNATLLALVLLWNIERAEGRLREGAEILREQLKLHGGIYSEAFWVGLFAPQEFQEEARAALARIAPDRFAELPRDAVFLGCMSAVADACHVLGDAEVAAVAYDVLLPHRSLVAVDGMATACYGSVERFLGLLATVLGRHGEAEAHFEAALVANRRMGAAALVADTEAAYGSMLVEVGDRDRGAALLRQALAGYAALGMDIRAGLVQERLETLAAAPEADVHVFRRDGEVWTATYAGVTVRLADSKGLRDIAALIDNQGREVHVIDLLAAGGARRSQPGIASAEGLEVRAGRAVRWARSSTRPHARRTGPGWSSCATSSRRRRPSATTSVPSGPARRWTC